MLTPNNEESRSIMGKNYLIYLLFLLPALIVAWFFNNDTSLSITLQWFFGFFMLIGFGVNTASATYRYPRATMSFILLYTGVNLLIITAFYASSYGTPMYNFLRHYAGALCYVPLEIMVEALLDFNMPQEVLVTIAVVVCMLIGYLFGLVHRHVKPDPYRPRIG